jgi:hypothetical protein
LSSSLGIFDIRDMSVAVVFDLLIIVVGVDSI